MNTVYWASAPFFLTLILTLDEVVNVEYEVVFSGYPIYILTTFQDGKTNYDFLCMLRAWLLAHLEKN